MSTSKTLGRIERGVWLILLVLVITLGGSIVRHKLETDNYWKSSGSFEMTGEFQKAGYSGTLCVGCGPDWNTTMYYLVVTTDERERVDREYPHFWRKAGVNPVKGQPGYVTYGRESTGNWCGEQPPQGALVWVKSPSGYTQDVTITEIETSKIYKSQGECYHPDPLLEYHKNRMQNIR